MGQELSLPMTAWQSGRSPEASKTKAGEADVFALQAHSTLFGRQPAGSRCS
jgi:hypothetical protein